jgi:hypothetical protein
MEQERKETEKKQTEEQEATEQELINPSRSFKFNFSSNATFINESLLRISKNLTPFQESVQRITEQFGKLIVEMNKALSKALAPLMEIDWEKVSKRWLKTAESLARRGWTIPPNMGISEMFEIADLKSRYEVDRAFANFYADKENFKEMKENLLKNKLLSEWHELLQQCFENYEKGNYLIVIPSLFTVLEGFAHKLVHPKFKISRNADKQASLSKKYEIVRKEVIKDSVTLAFYASAQLFIKKAFQFGGFDKENARRPFLINRNWVLHGRDNPAQWKRIDALRLLNAISTLTILDFLLEEE